MKTRTLVCLCGALAAWPLVEASAQAPALTPPDSALHALNRLAYGPRPGEVDRVAADGVMRWVDRQLSPRKIDDGPLAARERRFKILDYDAGELARVYVDAQRERREQKRAAATDSMTEKPEQAGPLEQRGRRLGAEFQELAVIRAVLSERQLYEVMVDFWANHFNVFFAKGADRFLTPSYIEQTIRPRALGKFADLLIATAESPAMLFYLDNWESVAPGATPPQAMRLRARPLFGPRPMFGRPPLFDPGHDPMRADSLRRQALARVPKGINENYARELLELHTLGVDGGYTQQDVINVARIFTGWSVRRPQQGGDFEFHDWAHDYGEKVVMGVMFPAGRGRDEGVRLLKLPANYPAQVVAGLGEPPFLHVAPDGDPEREDAWVNSGALLDRMNAAVALAAGRLPGVAVSLDSIVPATPDAERLIAQATAAVLSGTMSENTKQVIKRQISDISDPLQARALAIGLAIGA